MTYIDLTIQCLNDYKNNLNHISDAIEKHNVVILLGAPGSGKSSLLEKYFKEHSDICLIQKIIYFLRSKAKPEELKSVLLLDGLDEYRCTSNQEKTSIIIDLAEKLNNYKNKKIVISCREMDWYGETDLEPLKNFVGGDLGVYRILPLDTRQKWELAEMLEVEACEAFIRKYDKLGFLENPQLFNMLTKLHKEGSWEEIKSKKDLFLEFIGYAREKNPYYLKNNVNKIEFDKYIKCAGYIAFFYMLCNVENLDAALTDISSAEKGFSAEDLEITLQSGLFLDRRDFVHRTLAEFLAAHFLVRNKIHGICGIALNRVKSLFVQTNERVPTSLRGTYAWLCSLSGKDELIEVDPYYQAIHGDNAMFSPEFKEKIIRKVREYSKGHPYFYESGHQMSLEGFYTKDLEDFWLNELDEALELKNHYFYFLANLLVSTDKENIGEKMVARLKQCIGDKDIPSHYKRYMVRILNYDKEYLLFVLEKVKAGDIEDDSDGLKEEVLKTLYPEVVGPDKITDYLMLYKDRVYGHCMFLFDTPDQEKFNLIDRIYKASYDADRKPKLILPENVKSFIRDYFLETCLNFEEGLGAKEIYDILKHFKQFYKPYEPLKIESYRYVLTDKLRKSEEKLRNLANELFAHYLEDYLSGKYKQFSIIDFNSFFTLKSPDNIGKIILDKIQDDLTTDQQKELFHYVLIYTAREELKTDSKVKELAKKLKLEDKLEHCLNPQKQQWEIEDEERQKKFEEEQNNKRRANDEYFKGKSDKELIKSFNALDFVAWHFYLNDVPHQETLVSEKVLDRLQCILKKSIFEPVSPELLTVESLVENSPNAGRKVDQVYYTASILNEYEDLKSLEPELIEYLYINHLQHSRIGNVNRNNFLEELEKEHSEKAKAILCKYLKLLFEEYFHEIKDLFISYLNESVELSLLKDIARVHDEKELKNELLYSFCNKLNFNIKPDDLKIISEFDVNDKCKEIANALLAFNNPAEYEFSVNSAIALHDIYDHEPDKLKALSSDVKTKLLDLMMDKFNTAKSLETSDGFQTARDSCATFLHHDIWPFVSDRELKDLIDKRKEKNDLWFPLLINKLYKLNQQIADSEVKTPGLKRLKDFILNDAIISNKDFFAEVCFKIHNLKDRIEANRNAEKKLFYAKEEQKVENDCTTVIRNLLEEGTKDWIWSSEKPEAEKRVDLNVKYSLNLAFEVQIECKRDKHQEIYSAIQEQLIDKYLCKQVQFGIYLVYFFGNKDKERMLKRIRESIPVKFKDNIELICIDLTDPNKVSGVKSI